MNRFIEKYKGIHPGLILERELEKRKIKKGPFAISLQEYPQTLNEIIKGRRGLTPLLSLKIDQSLGFDEGTMLMLQTHYEIERVKDSVWSVSKPNLSLLRKALFWDTDFDTINWRKQYKPVIKRVFQRGNEMEKEEICRFYGEDTVSSVLKDK